MPRMNHTQRGVVGTTVIALFVAALFYVPWRIESSGDLQWAPFYRNPAVGRSTMTDYGIESRYIELKGRPIVGLYLLQLAAIGGIGFVAFRAVRDRGES